MKYNKGFLKFIKNSVTCFHAIEEIKTRLIKEGYEEYTSSVELNKKYFVTKNNSSIIAFTTPTKLENFHFQMTSSHSDSPTYKLKPNHETTNFNYSSLNVETYGGPIHQTWFDKPLSVAGRIFVKTNNKIEQKLINIDKDLMVIPSLSIHLNENSNKMTYNPQIDLQPLYSLNKEDVLLKYIAKDNNIKEEDIIDFDLFLYNRFRGTILGLNNEFIQAPQLDDLLMTYATIESLINSKNNTVCNIVAVFDNEEVGSRTKQGAASTFLKDTMNNIMNDLGVSTNEYTNVLNKSFMISADNAHAIHPNYPGKTDNLNGCLMNKGIAIKYNSNQNYTTDGFSASIFKMLCDNSNVKYQPIANRSDIRGGSTLGNISTTQVSVNSVDIGLPQLSMHSSCEIAGCNDLDDLVKVMDTYFKTSLNIKTDSVEFN